jgi:hypothetical protein
MLMLTAFPPVDRHHLGDLLTRSEKMVLCNSPESELVEEYQLVTQLLATETSNHASGISRRERQTLSQGSLKRRDKFIAERIDTTLQPGETGILFLGMLHSLSGLLAPDIELMDPFLPRSGKVRPWKASNP